MSISGIGDLAQSLMLRRQGAGLKANMTRLTQELTTGQSQDVSKRVKGDFGALAGIERHLGQLQAFQGVRDELAPQLVFIQSSLETIQSSVDDYGARMLASLGLENSDAVSAQLSSARNRLEQVVSSLNTQQGGKFLFSGLATNTAPLAGVDTIMAALETEISGATDAADVLTRVESWFFDVGGGFETLIYNGSDMSAENIRISENNSVDLPVAARDTGFREIMRGLALAVLVAEDAVALPQSEKDTLIDAAGTGIIAGQNEVTAYRAAIGDVEAALAREDLSARAEQTLISETRAKLISVDPFEAAAELEAAQFQMETLYLLTARMSQLRLTDYLR